MDIYRSFLDYLHFLRPFPCFFFFFIRRDLVLLRTLIIFLSPSVFIPYRYRYTHLIPFAPAKGFFIDYTWRGFTCIVKEKLKSSCRLTLLSS